MNLPLVTVAICTYNGERYLAATLDSVLAQTYSNMEVIIVDDGSRDGTVAIIQQYAERDSRIRWFARENAGLPASRNFAFTQAQGEWIAIIDQDDLCYPERLARQVAVAVEYPSAGLIFCDTHHIDAEGGIIGNHLSSYALPNSFIPRGVAAALLLTEGCYVDSEAWFIQRTAVKQLGPLDESLRYACDYEYFIRAGFKFDFAYTSDVLAAWRVHPGQESVTNHNRFREYRSVLGRYWSHADVTWGARFTIASRLGRSHAGEAYRKACSRLRIGISA